MILSIRTDSPVTHLALHNAGILVCEKHWESGRTLAKNVLTKITDLCKEAAIDITKIEGIVLYKGPGSFTGLRIGATVANTLAYANSIPIVGTIGDDWLMDGLQKLVNGDDEKIILPEYGSEAHITL